MGFGVTVIYFLVVGLGWLAYGLWPRDYDDDFEDIDRHSDALDALGRLSDEGGQ